SYTTLFRSEYVQWLAVADRALWCDEDVVDRHSSRRIFGDARGEHCLARCCCLQLSDARIAQLHVAHDGTGTWIAYSIHRHEPMVDANDAFGFTCQTRFTVLVIATQRPVVVERSLESN